MNPFLYNISMQRWEYFLTLTFTSRDAAGKPVKVPSEPERRKMLFAFLRRAAEGNKRDGSTGKRLDCIKWEEFLWVVREERGEFGGRYHFHALLAGFPPSRINNVERFSLRSIWNDVGGGYADVRAFDAKLRGASYVLKGLEGWSRRNANAFEAARFNEENDRELIVSKSALVKWARRTAGRAPKTLGTQPGIPAVSLSARKRVPLNELETSAGMRWAMSANMHPAGVSRLF